MNLAPAINPDLYAAFQTAINGLDDEQLKALAFVCPAVHFSCF